MPTAMPPGSSGIIRQIIIGTAEFSAFADQLQREMMSERQPVELRSIHQTRKPSSPFLLDDKVC